MLLMNLYQHTQSLRIQTDPPSSVDRKPPSKNAATEATVAMMESLKDSTAAVGQLITKLLPTIQEPSAGDKTKDDNEDTDVCVVMETVDKLQKLIDCERKKGRGSQHSHKSTLT